MEDSQMTETDEHLLLYGNDSTKLSYFDLTDHTKTILSINAYGQIAKMKLLADESTLIATTLNGVIINFQVFSRVLGDNEEANEDEEDIGTRPI